MHLKNKTRITLISSYNYTIANGLRIISAYLKSHGHDVQLIFFNDDSSKKFSEEYNEVIFGDLIELCKSSDLIGFSLMTNHFFKIKELTVKIKQKLGAPIIWGGIHPTVKPEECLEYADMVCVGEGEEAVLELADNLQSGNIFNIRNIWHRSKNKVFRNEIRDLEQNLDKYPFQDYDLTTHYLLSKGRIVKMTEQLLEESMPKNNELGPIDTVYHVLTTRNCPYNCSFCCNNALRKIYDKKGTFVRKRSPKNIIDEIVLIKQRFNFIKQILITDDTFFIRSTEEVEGFSKLYKEKVNLPFKCNVSPQSLNENKLAVLIEAGLFRISMGVQSFSYETLVNVFNRPTSLNSIVNAVKIINKYSSRLPHPIYHIIVDNPYESRDSVKENIKFVASIPKGSKVTLFPLVAFPGTELYRRAHEDNVVKDEVKEIYLKSWLSSDIQKHDYLTYILYFYCWFHQLSIGTKQLLRKVLLSSPVIFFCDNKIFINILLRFYMVFKIARGKKS